MPGIDYARDARERDAGDIQVPAHQMILIPEGRHAHGEVHVIGQQRRAGSCARAGEYPTVAAQALVR